MQDTKIEKSLFFGININDPAIYSCGQYVKGHVVVEANEEETTNTSVGVKFVGKGNVHWEESVVVIY